MTEVESKRCTKCLVKKPLVEFYADKYSNDKKKSWCKRCCKLAQRVYQQTPSGKDVNCRASLKQRKKNPNYSEERAENKRFTMTLTPEQLKERKAQKNRERQRRWYNNNLLKSKRDL